jgi:multidrug efflux pump subunit AcrB
MNWLACPGVGQVQIFGSGDYAMRIWLNPDKIASRGLTAGDVVAAVREQNIQVSAGQLGAEPIAKAPTSSSPSMPKAACVRPRSSATSC